MSRWSRRCPESLRHVIDDAVYLVEVERREQDIGLGEQIAGGDDRGDSVGGYHRPVGEVRWRNQFRPEVDVLLAAADRFSTLTMLLAGT